MDLNNVLYDEKFQEMQEYIPFLNDIIDKLENVSSECSQSNLRGIQLSKIKSLKTLLTDKNKRMKIENLLRCEDILKKLKDKVGKQNKNDLMVELGDSQDSTERQIDIAVAPKSTNLNFYKEFNNEQEISKVVSSTMHHPDSENGSLSDFEACRKKLREVTKDSINEKLDVPSPIKPLEKEIQIVTNAYIQGYTQIEILSKVISESLDKITRSKSELFNEGKNRNVCSKSKSEEKVEDESKHKKTYSPIKFPNPSSERKHNKSPKEWRKKYESDYHSNASKDNMKDFDIYKDSDKTEQKKKSKKDKNKEKDLRHKHKHETVDNKATKEKSENDNSLEKNNMSISDEASLSFLIKCRNIIKKELEDVKDLKDISLDVTDFNSEEIKELPPKIELPKEDGEIGESEEEQELIIDILYNTLNGGLNSTQIQSTVSATKGNSSTTNVKTKVKGDHKNESIIKFKLKKSDNENKLKSLTPSSCKYFKKEVESTSNLAKKDVMETILEDKKDFKKDVTETIFRDKKDFKKDVTETIFEYKKDFKMDVMETIFEDKTDSKMDIMETILEDKIFFKKNVMETISENKKEFKNSKKEEQRILDIKDKSKPKNVSTLNAEVKKICDDKSKKQRNNPEPKETTPPNNPETKETTPPNNPEPKEITPPNNPEPKETTPPNNPEPKETPPPNNLEPKETTPPKTLDFIEKHITESKVSKLDIKEERISSQPITVKTNKTFEQDVLEALNDELKDVSTEDFNNFLHGQIVHHEVKKCESEQNENKKMRRISFEKYKEKNNSCSADPVQTSGMQISSSRGLTPKEIERFNFTIDKYKDPLDVFNMPKLNKSYIIPKKDKFFNECNASSPKPCIALDITPHKVPIRLDNNEKAIEEKHDPLLAHKMTIPTFKTNLHGINEISSPREICDNTTFIDVQNQFTREVRSDNIRSELNESIFIKNKFLSQDDNDSERPYSPSRQLPLYTNRFNVGYPVSANYRGKNPKPFLNRGYYKPELNISKHLPEILKTKPSSPLLPLPFVSNEHSIKSIGEASFEDCEKRKNFPTTNAGFKNIIKCESIKELSLHKSAKAKHTYSTYPTTSQDGSLLESDRQSSATFKIDSRNSTKESEATVHSSYTKKSMSISKQDPRLNKMATTVSLYEYCSTYIMNNLTNQMPSIMTSINSYVEARNKTRSKDPRLQGYSKFDLPAIKDYLMQYTSDYYYPDAFHKLYRKERKNIRNIMRCNILSSYAEFSSKNHEIKQYIENKELHFGTDSEDSSSNLMSYPKECLPKSSDNKKMEHNVNYKNEKDVILIDVAKTFVVYDENIGSSVKSEVKEIKVDEPSETIVKEDNILPNFRNKQHDLISINENIKVESEQMETNNLDHNSTMKDNTTIEDNKIAESEEVKVDNSHDTTTNASALNIEDNKIAESEEVKVDNSHDTNTNDSALNTVCEEIDNNLPGTSISDNQDINNDTEMDVYQEVDKPSDVNVKESPVNSSEVNSDNINNSGVSMLFDVLKDKQKILEMISLLSQHGEDIPLKMKKRIQLLAEIESDDESETLSVKSETMSIKSPKPDFVELPNNQSTLNVMDESKSKQNNLNEPKKTKSRARWRNEVELLKSSLPEMFIIQGGLKPVGIRMCRLAKEFTSDSTYAENNETVKRTTRQNDKKTVEKKNNLEMSPSPQKIKKKVSDPELRIMVTKLNIFDKKPVIIEEVSSIITDDKETNDILSKYDLKPCPKFKKLALIEELQNEKNSQPVKPEVKKTYSKPCPKSKKNISVLKIVESKSVESKPDISENLNECDDYDKADSPSNQQIQKPQTKKALLKSNKISVKKKKKGTWCKGTLKKRIRKKTCVPKKNTNDKNKQSKNVYVDYHFSSSMSTYPCKYCDKSDENIVNHYIKAHPHEEILISRLSSKEGSEAIADSKKNVTYDLDKEFVDNYHCRFCHLSFNKKNVNDFYEHVKYFHTGEYKHDCKLCGNLCKNNALPDENLIDYLKGYICGRCNYTQIARENIETHIAIQHKNEDCQIYKINLVKLIDAPKVTRSSVNKELGCTPPEKTVTPPIETNTEVHIEEDTGIFSLSSKVNELSDIDMSAIDTIGELHIKEELLDINHEIHLNDDLITYPIIKTESFNESFNNSEENLLNMLNQQEDGIPYNTIDNFTINDCCVGGLEVRKNQSNTNYFCKINSCDYTDDIFLNFQRHVDTVHVDDLWNGYCIQCFKNITKTPVAFSFAIEHMINEHVKSNNDLDLVNNEVVEERQEIDKSNVAVIEKNNSPKINENNQTDDTAFLPRIESVVSLKSEYPTMNDFYSSSTQKDVEYNAFSDLETHEKLPEGDHQTQTNAINNEIQLDIDYQSKKMVDNNLYICCDITCDYSTNVMDDFVYHIKRHRDNNQNLRICIYCKYVSNTDEEIGLHISKEHGHCQYKCNDCLYRGVSFIAVCAHSILMHPETKGSLRVKELTECVQSDNKKLTAGILSKKVAFQPYICTAKKDVMFAEDPSDTCNKQFYLRNEFLNHANKMHKNEKLNCQSCHTYMMSPLDLLTHYNRQHNFKTFKCSYCVCGAESRMLMLHHLINTHPNRSPIFYSLVSPENKNLLPRLLKINIDSLINYHLKHAFGFFEMLNNDNLINSKKITVKIVKVNKSTTVERIYSLKTKQSTTSVDINIVDDDDDDGVPSKRMKFNDVLPTDQPSGYKNVINEDNLKIVNDSGKEMPTQIKGLHGKDLFICGNKGCDKSFAAEKSFSSHVFICKLREKMTHYECFHCHRVFKNHFTLIDHTFIHGDCHECVICKKKFEYRKNFIQHLHHEHSEKVKEYEDVPVLSKSNELDDLQMDTKSEKGKTFKKSDDSNVKTLDLKRKEKKTNCQNGGVYGLDDYDELPDKPILSEFISCKHCDYKTKVTPNFAKHLHQHMNNSIVSSLAPVNPVPHLKTNEMYFDKMTNLALSSNIDKFEKVHKYNPELIPKFVPSNERYVCGAPNCHYISIDETMLNNHWDTLHKDEVRFYCIHCKKDIELLRTTMTPILAHLRLHGPSLYRCCDCDYMDSQELVVNRHIFAMHKIERASAIMVRCEKKSVLSGSSFNWNCSFCSVTADKKIVIVEHCKSVHNIEFPFTCGLCKFTSKISSAINIHSSKKHKGENATMIRSYYKKNVKASEANDQISQQQRKRGYDDKMLKESSSSPPPFKKVRIENYSESFVDPVIKTDDKITHESQTKLTSSALSEQLCDIVCVKNLSLIDWTSQEYYCIFCKKFITNDVSNMKFHLYEDLNYKKWQCNICKYKSFNPNRVDEHSITEHRISSKVKTLTSNIQIESRVSRYITLQTKYIVAINTGENIDSAVHAALLLDEAVQEPESDNQLASPSYTENYSSDDEDKLFICDNEAEVDTVTKTNNEQYTCKLCSFVGKNLKIHNVRMHFRPCKCSYCNFVSGNELEMFSHHSKFHDKEEFKIYNIPCDHPEVPSTSKFPSRPTRLVCIICKTSLKSIDVDFHKKSCFSKYTTNTVLNKQTIVKKCLLCTKLYPDEASMSKHFEVQHDDAEVVSVETTLSKEVWHTISKKVNVKSVLNALSTKEDRKDKFVCVYCSRGFTKYYGFSRHHAVKHNRNIICFMPLVKKSIQDTGEVKKSFNLTDEMYECVVMHCRETFNDATTFGAHIKEHYCVFKCAKCPKSFNLNEPYSNHCITDHSDIPGATLKDIGLLKEEEVCDRIKQIEVLLNILLSRRSENLKNTETKAEMVVESPNASEKIVALPKPKQVARKSTTPIGFYTS